MVINMMENIKMICLIDKEYSHVLMEIIMLDNSKMVRETVME